MAVSTPIAMPQPIAKVSVACKGMVNATASKPRDAPQYANGPPMMPKAMATDGRAITHCRECCRVIANATHNVAIQAGPGSAGNGAA